MSSTDSRHLADLARRSLTAAWDGDARAARLAAAEFAASGYADRATPPPDLDEELHGAYHGLRRSVAEALGMDDAAHAAAMDWTGWAISVDNAAHELRARARLAVDEANRWLRFVDDGSGGAEVTDVPLLAQVVRGLPGREGTPSPAKEPADPILVDAMLQAEAAATLVRRPDIADPLANWLRDQSEAPGAENLADAVTLIDACHLHAVGDLPAAARLCASAAENPVGEPVTAAIDFRRELAIYSMEAGQDETAARMLELVAAEAKAAGLALDHLAAAHLAMPVLERLGRMRERRAMARDALAGAAGFPSSPALDEVSAAAK